MNWKQPRSIEELKALCLGSDENAVEGFIQLGGGARSSKRIAYYPDQEKCWDIYESICDEYVELTDEEFLTTGNFALALERRALFIESDEPEPDKSEKGGAL